MKRGPASFLSTRSKEDAFDTVERLYQEEGFVLRRVAKRLAVHSQTLYRWLRRYPEYEARLAALQAEAFEPKEGK